MTRIDYETVVGVVRSQSTAGDSGNMRGKERNCRTQPLRPVRCKCNLTLTSEKAWSPVPPPFFARAGFAGVPTVLNSPHIGPRTKRVSTLTLSEILCIINLSVSSQSYGVYPVHYPRRSVRSQHNHNILQSHSGSSFRLSMSGNSNVAVWRRFSSSSLSMDRSESNIGSYDSISSATGIHRLMIHFCNINNFFKNAYSLQFFFLNTLIYSWPIAKI